MERAFELARSGNYLKVEQIREVLSKEGCEGVIQHLTGRGLKLQLLSIMKDAREKA